MIKEYIIWRIRMLLDAIKLGPFVIRYLWLFLFISGLIGYIAIKIRSRPFEKKEAIVNTITNGVIIWLITWKISYVFLNPNDLIQNPLSFLYFNGGLLGQFLGFILVIFYFYWCIKKYKINWKRLLDSLFIGLLTSNILFLTCMIFILHINSIQLIVLLVMLFIVFVFYLVNTNKRKEGVIDVKKIFASALIIGLIVYGLIGAFTSNNEQEGKQLGTVGIDKGNTAPDFQLKTVNDDTIRLSDYRGKKKIILNFWATWCPPCRAEMPAMQEFYEKNKDDVVILAVNMTHLEKQNSDVSAFIKEYGLTFPVLIQQDGTISNDHYNVISIPTTYFIDSNGKIQNKVSGAVSYEVIASTIANMD